MPNNKAVLTLKEIDELFDRYSKTIISVVKNSEAFGHRSSEYSLRRPIVSLILEVEELVLEKNS